MNEIQQRDKPLHYIIVDKKDFLIIYQCTSKTTQQGISMLKSSKNTRTPPKTWVSYDLIIQGESTKTKNIFVEHKKNIINIPYESKYHFKFQSLNENLLLDQCEILQSKSVNHV